jgi:hypothetical protein
MDQWTQLRVLWEEVSPSEIFFCEGGGLRGQGAQIHQKQSRGHFKIVLSGRVTRSKFLPEGPQILGVTVRNSAAMTKWRLGFVFRYFNRGRRMNMTHGEKKNAQKILVVKARHC